MKPDSANGSPVSYSYSPVGQQKRIEQTAKRYGNRISILGVWQPGVQFEYALAQGSFKSQSYIKVMDWVAHKAAQTLAQTGRLTVLVQDNGSSLASLVVREQWTRLSCTRLIYVLSTSLLFANESN